MKTRQQTINNRIRAKRDILQILSNTKDKLSRKDLTMLISILQGRGGTGTMTYSYNVMIWALKELEKAGQIKRSWSWGAKGNWEHRYQLKDSQE